MGAAVPTVSVILPCYQGEAHIASAIERLLRQTHPAVQIVVVDDASTDRSVEIARGFADAHENVVLVVQEENAGVAAARERGVQAASGEWVWLVDDDDEWPEDAVATLVAAALDRRADVVVAGAVTVDSGSESAVGTLRGPALLSGRAAFVALLNGRLTGHLWNKLFRRSLFGAIDFTRIRQHSDQAQVAQLFAAAREVAVIPDQVYRYLLRQGSIIRSGAKRADSLAELARVIERTARGLDPALLSSADYRYYQARFSLLSRFKDATSGAHDAAEARTLWADIRSEAGPRHLLALLGRRDAKRAALFGAAYLTPALYRVAMEKGRGRR